MARRALSGGLAALLAIISSLVLASAPSIAATTAAAPPRPGTAMIFIEDRVSFEELMAVPEFQALARAGGAGLMATNQSYRDDMHDVYLALGAGAAPGSADAQLLGRTLASSHVLVCAIETGTGPGGGSAERLIGVPDMQNCNPTAGGSSFVFLVFDSSLLQLDQEAGGARPSINEARRADLLRKAGTVLDAFSTTADRWLFMAIAPSPSKAMNQAGDEVTPLVMAEGPANRLLSVAGPMHALTSDTTRQTGLVANVDVAPTILDFFGIPIPSAMEGSVIRTTDDPAPFALYRLEREQRRVRFPIQLGVVLFLAFAAVVGAIGLLLLARGRRLSPSVLEGLRFLVLCCVALPIPLMAGGLMPRRTYLAVVPFVIGATLALALAARRAGGDDPLRQLSLLGGAGLAFIVVDAVFGGHAFRTPLFGGIMFDGVRYYGMGNAFIPTLVASSVFVAWRLERMAAVALLFGVGMVAGFPHLLADIGASITLFATAGIWWALSARPRPPLGDRRAWGRAILAVGVAVVGGLAIVLIVNRYGPGTPTHATRFVEHANGRLGTAIHDLWHRLGVGVGQIRRYPVGLLPLIGLPVALWLAMRAPGPIGDGLRAVDGRWRDVVVALVLAAFTGYLANDTGVAASAPAFLYVFAALALPAFAERERVSV